MAEGLCAKCSRYLLIVFNFFFWISGAAMLGIGIWILVDPDIQSSFDKVNVSLPQDVTSIFAYVLIAVGSFIFITGFCGCCGAMRESAWMIAMYIGCVVIVLVAELVGGIYIAVERSHLEAMFKESIMDQVKNYNSSGDSQIDFLQKQFNCCGAENYTNYKDSAYSTLLRSQKNTSIDTWYVPPSCCNSIISIDDNDNLCWKEAQERSNSPKTQLRTEGCYNKAMSYVNDNITIIVGVVIGVAFLEIVGVIFAIILCRNRTEYWDWD